MNSGASVSPKIAIKHISTANTKHLMGYGTRKPDDVDLIPEI